MTTVADGLYQFGGIAVGDGDYTSIARARSFGDIGTTQDARTKVIYVDPNVNTARQGCRGSRYANIGESWLNPTTTCQAGINEARYDYGTSTMNYTHGKDAWVFLAPAEYGGEGRIAFSTGGNMHIIGVVSPVGTDKGANFDPSSPSTFAFGGSGSGLELANIRVGTDSAVYTFYWQNLHACWIHDCEFYGNGTTSTVGMHIDDMKASVIERCRIKAQVTAGINVTSTAASKYMENSEIRNNVILASGTCTDGIKIASTLTGPSVIRDNYIGGSIHTETIDCDATAAQFLIANNFLHGTTSAAQGGTSRGNSTS